MDSAISGKEDFKTTSSNISSVSDETSIIRFSALGFAGSFDENGRYQYHCLNDWTPYVQLLQIDEYFKKYRLSAEEIASIAKKETVINLNSSKSIAANETLVLQKQELFEDAYSLKKIYNINKSLVKIETIPENGEDPIIWNVDEDFSFDWKLTEIYIFFHTSKTIENAKLRLTFSYNELRVRKSRFGIEEDVRHHPAILLFKEDASGISQEIIDGFFYVHDINGNEDYAPGVCMSLYFSDDSIKNDTANSYFIGVVDYHKIYDFDVKIENAFEKNAKFDLSQYAASDGRMDANNLTFTFKDANGDVVKSCTLLIEKNDDTRLSAAILPEETIISGILGDGAEYDMTVSECFINSDGRFDDAVIDRRSISFNHEPLEACEISGEYPYANIYGWLKDIAGNRINDKLVSIIENTVPSTYLCGIIPSETALSSYASDRYWNDNQSYKDWYLSKIRHGAKPLTIEFRSEDVDGLKFVFDCGYKKFDWIQYANRYDFIFRRNLINFVKERVSMMPGYEYSRYEANQYETGFTRESIKPGNYKIVFKLGDKEIKGGSIAIDKDDRSLQNFEIEWPYANIVGRIVNKTTNEVLHKGGAKVRLTNLQDSSTYEFRYEEVKYTTGTGSFPIFKNDDDDYAPWGAVSQAYIYQTYEDFSKYKSGNKFIRFNTWDYRFKFLMNGNNETVYSASELPDRVADRLRSAQSVPSGTYRVDIVDDNNTIIFTPYESLEVNRNTQNELYDLEIKSPLCNVSGILFNDDNETVFEDGWEVWLEPEGSDGKKVVFKFDSFHPDNNKKYFEFRGLGRERPFGKIKENSSVYSYLTGVVFANDNDEEIRYGESYYAPGVLPGVYTVKAVYQGEAKKSIEHQVISKEAEATGNGYISISIEVPSIFTSLNALIYDNATSSYLDHSGAKISLTGMFGNNEAYSVSSNSGNALFESIPNLGKYIIEVTPTNYFDGARKIFNSRNLNEINDIVESYDFQKEGALDTFNILSHEDIDGDGRKQMTVKMNYWLHPLKKSFAYSDEHQISNTQYNKYDEYFSSVRRLSEEKPFFKTNLRMTNTTLGITSSILNANSYESSYSYSEGYQRNDLWRSGEYRIDLMNALNNEVTASSKFMLSSYEQEQYDSFAKIYDDLNCKTLNMNILIYREDIGRYEMLTRYKFVDEKIHKLEIEKNGVLSAYYHNGSYEVGPDYLNYFLKDKSFVILSGALPGIDGYSITWQQPKAIFQQLKDNETYRYSMTYSSKMPENSVTFKGLFKGDISNNFDIEKYSSTDFKEARLLKPMSLRNLMLTYVIPQIRHDHVTSNDTAEINDEIDEIFNAASTYFGNDFDTSYRFENADDLSTLEQRANETLSFLDGKKIVDFTGPIADLFANKLSSTEGGATFNLSSLALENPNPIPIKYASLIVDKLNMCIYAHIMGSYSVTYDSGFPGDAPQSYDVNFAFNPAYLDLPLKLSIYAADGITLEKEMWNSKSWFFIPFIESGKHRFVVTAEADDLATIYDEYVYLYNDNVVDLFLSKESITTLKRMLLKYEGRNAVAKIFVNAKNEDDSIWQCGQVRGASNTYNGVINSYLPFSSINDNVKKWIGLSGNSSDYVNYGIHYLMMTPKDKNFTLSYYLSPRTAKSSSFGSYHYVTIRDDVQQKVDGESFNVSIPTSFIAEEFPGWEIEPMKVFGTYSYRSFGSDPSYDDSIYYSSSYSYSQNASSNHVIELAFSSVKNSDDSYSVSIDKAHSIMPEDMEHQLSGVQFRELAIHFGIKAGDDKTVFTDDNDVVVNLDKMVSESLTIRRPNALAISNKWTYEIKRNGNAIPLTNGLNFISDSDIVNSVTVYGLPVGSYDIKVQHLGNESDAPAIEWNDTVQILSTSFAHTLQAALGNGTIRIYDKALGGIDANADVTSKVYKSFIYENYLVSNRFSESQFYSLYPLNYGISAEYHFSDSLAPASYGIPSSDYKWPQLASYAVASGSNDIKLEVPWQFFKLNIVGYDGKTKTETNSKFDSNHSYLALRRLTNDAAYGDEYDVYYNGKDPNIYVKSGKYAMTMHYYENDIVGSITLEDQVIDRDMDSSYNASQPRIPILVNDPSIISVQLRVSLLAEDSSGAYNVLPICQNAKINLRDYNGALIWRSFTTDNNGQYSASLNDVYAFKYKFEIGGRLSNEIEIFTNGSIINVTLKIPKTGNSLIMEQ